MGVSLRAPGPIGPDIDELKERIDIVDFVERYGRVELHGKGIKRRGKCPKHEGDSDTAFRVNTEAKTWKCFRCDAYGDIFAFLAWVEGRDVSDREWFREAVQRVARDYGLDGLARPATPREAKPRKIMPQQAPQERGELYEALSAFQAALPGSPAETYLRDVRCIELDVAIRMGLGYAAPGRWLGRALEYGRVVFPHTDPDGRLVSLYGRAIGGDEVPKAVRHDHLAGDKGFFNAQALRNATGLVYVTEGAFDALALIAAGVEQAVGIFGVAGWRWDWAKPLSSVVIAFDNDDAGRKAAEELAPEAVLRGLDVEIMESESFGGEKDLAAAWARGVLRLGDALDRDIRPGDVEAMTLLRAYELAEDLPVLPKQAAYELARVIAYEWTTAEREDLRAQLIDRVGAFPATLHADDLYGGDCAPAWLPLAQDVFALKIADFIARGIARNERLARERATSTSRPIAEPRCMACGKPGAWGSNAPCPRCHPRAPGYVDIVY